MEWGLGLISAADYAFDLSFRLLNFRDSGGAAFGDELRRSARIDHFRSSKVT